MTEPTQPARPDQQSVDPASSAHPPADLSSSETAAPPSPSANGSAADGSAPDRPADDAVVGASADDAAASDDAAPSDDAASPGDPVSSGDVGERVVAPDETTRSLPPLVLDPPAPQAAPNQSTGAPFAGFKEPAAAMPLPPTGSGAPKTPPRSTAPDRPAAARSPIPATASAPIPAAEVPAALRGPEAEKQKQAAGKLLGVSVNQILAGALAASTSAVAASFLGVAGTVLGAGLGSVIATVSTAVYQKSIQHSKPLLQRVTTTVVGKDTLAGAVAGGLSESRASVLAPDPHLPSATQVGRGLPDPHLAEAPRSPPRTATGHHPPAGGSPYDETVPVATPALPTGRPGVGSASVPPPARAAGKVYGGGPWYAGLPWKRIAVASALIFVVAMGALVTIEFATGRPIADAVQGKKGSGTTISHLVGGDSSTSGPAPTETDTGDPTPTDTSSEDATPSDSPSPSDQPSDSSSPSDTSEPTDQAPETPAATDNQAGSPTDGVPQPEVETNTTPSPVASLLR